MKAHRSFLKPYDEDKVMGRPTPLFFHKRTVPDTEAQPDEWNVEKILKHKVDPQGQLKFLTKWEGCEPGTETWEPIGNFIHRYSSDFVRYCKQNHLVVDLTKHLSIIPSQPQGIT